MAYTIYDGFVLQAKRALTALSQILHKAEEHPNASKFPSSRLYPDMKSLSYQVRSVTVQTQMVMARLMNQELPPYEFDDDPEYSYAEMYERIDHTLKIIQEADKEYIIAHGEDVQNLKLGPLDQPMSGIALASLMQANIFFHTTTAYGILRKEGLEIGKSDYILPFLTVQE